MKRRLLKKMAKLPKRLIKKYGISKKAWSVFRSEQNSRKRKSKSRSTTPKTRTKFKTVRRQMAKKRTRRRKGMSMRTKALLGAMGYAVLGEPLLDMVATKLGVSISDDIVKGLAGWFIANNTSGVVSSVGNAAMTIAAYKFGLSNLKGFGGNLFGASSSGITVTPISNSGATFQ